MGLSGKVAAPSPYVMKWRENKPCETYLRSIFFHIGVLIKDTEGYILSLFMGLIP